VDCQNHDLLGRDCCVIRFVPSISATLQDMGFSFFDNARTFYLMRFIFGAAEAGFVPGIILYLTYWFTADKRARWVGVFLSGAYLALIIGGPISGLILDTLDGYMGLRGWQWLFIIEGVLLRDNLDENGSGDRNVKRRPMAT
jgi:MFS family permease